MIGELAEMKAAKDLLAREAFKKASGLARQKDGIPVYNALTDEPEMYNVSNLQAIEPYLNLEPSS